MATNGFRVPPRVSPIDRLGRDIDPAVLVAAEEVYDRALEHGVRLLGDPAVVVDTLEQVAAAVSRLVTTQASRPDDPCPIKNLPGYIFRSFVRQINRLKRKQVVLVNGNGDGEASQPRWADPSGAFEIKILVDECLAVCDRVARDMFWRRVQGFSWDEIGKTHGLSGHAAQERFRHALRRAQARLGNGTRSGVIHEAAHRIEKLEPGT